MSIFNPNASAAPLAGRLAVAAALAAALLAGCGGDSHVDAGASAPPGPVAQTVTDVVAYISGLIAGGSDSAEPLDTTALTLAADDAAEPAPVQ